MQTQWWVDMLIHVHVSQILTANLITPLPLFLHTGKVSLQQVLAIQTWGSQSRDKISLFIFIELGGAEKYELYYSVSSQIPPPKLLLFPC